MDGRTTERPIAPAAVAYLCDCLLCRMCLCGATVCAVQCRAVPVKRRTHTICATQKQKCSHSYGAKHKTNKTKKKHIVELTSERAKDQASFQI